MGTAACGNWQWNLIVEIDPSFFFYLCISIIDLFNTFVQFSCPIFVIDRDCTPTTGTHWAGLIDTNSFNRVHYMYKIDFLGTILYIQRTLKKFKKSTPPDSHHFLRSLGSSQIHLFFPSSVGSTQYKSTPDWFSFAFLDFVLRFAFSFRLSCGCAFSCVCANLPVWKAKLWEFLEVHCSGRWFDGCGVSVRWRLTAVRVGLVIFVQGLLDWEAALRFLCFSTWRCVS